MREENQLFSHNGRRRSGAFCSQRLSGRGRLGILSILAAGLVGLLTAVSGSPQPIENPALAARGETLYNSLCRRCHGGDGDATEYPGIVPLAAIDLRLPPSRIARLSAPFVGRTFEGPDAEALVAYLARLPGSKGFTSPGYLFSPYLLHHKVQDRSHYRVLDVRPKPAYQAGHIPNAVWWRTEEPDRELLREPPQRVRDKLASLGVSPDTFVVVYDELGGPDAARLWWSLQDAGLRRSAVLDGGLRAWTAAGYTVSRLETRLEAGPGLPAFPPPTAPKAPNAEPVPLVLGSGSPETSTFDWRKALADSGLHPGSEIRQYLNRCGIRLPGSFRVEGRVHELAYLVWLLRLLGFQASYDEGSGILTVVRDE